MNVIDHDHHLHGERDQVDGYDRRAEVAEGGHGSDRYVRYLDSTNCCRLHNAIHEHWGEEK